MEDLQIADHAMIIRMVDWLSKTSELKIILISLIILVGIGVLQTVTRTRMTMAPFYLIPIALVTLRSTRTAGLLTSIACGVMWISMDVRSEYVFLWLDTWNNLLRVGVFVSFALILARLKGDMVREMKLNAHLQEALAEVKQLSGLLPICAWCKRIRDDEGNWQQIETYITVHSEADFTHGICPDCARKHEAR
jgi:K+-sensing histidine kinase KdpD